MRIFSFGLLTSEDTDTQVVAPGLRNASVAVRRPAELGAVEPAAAADNAAGAILRTRRICNTHAGIFTVPILTPFPHVPVHVV